MKKKIISLCLASAITLSMFPTSVFAASIGSIDTDKNIGEDTVQGQKTYYSQLKESSAETEVYLTVDESELLVSVPTTIILDGNPNEAGEYTADYSVGVKGDISGTKTVTVTPESDTVNLKQVGKGDKEATVLQAQTDFTQNDFKNETVTTGHLSAQSLTAGSWNGTFDFLINVNQIKSFYSSLDLAAQDINAQTVATKDTLADLATAQGAVCGVYKTADETKLVLLTDVTEQSTISLTQPVKINLNHYSVTFSDGEYLISTADLSVVNGQINVKEAKGAILPGGNNFTLQNVSVSAAVETISNNTFAIYSNSTNNIIDNCNLTVSNLGTKGGACIVILNANSINFISDSILNATSISNTLMGIQCGGNTFCENDVITTTASNAAAYGIWPYNANSLNVTNCNIVTENDSNTKTAYGIYTKVSTFVTNSDLKAFNSNKACAFYALADAVINGGNFYATGTEALGIGTSYTSNSLTINSTEQGPVSVFGTEWGISSGNNTQINGGVYISREHPLYFNNSATINDALIYSTGNTTGPIYFGGPNCPEDAVLNLNRCTLGNPNATSQNGLYTIVSTRNKTGYTTGTEVNITDCNLYQSSSALGHMFSYHNVYKDGTNLNQTKFNLYGNTKLYKEYDSEKGCWVEYSKVEVASLIDPSWKTTVNSLPIGNKLVWSPNSVVTDGVLVTNNLTDDAGVYDYRD
ncbi:MAG: hypothetical protein ACI37Z_05120 [Candidatus Gastranaerophilaceae bacterium]